MLCWKIFLFLGSSFSGSSLDMEKPIADSQGLKNYTPSHVNCRKNDKFFPSFGLLLMRPTVIFACCYTICDMFC